MISGPSPCSATCKRMPFVSIIRCVTAGIAESTQGAGSAPLGSAAAALSGSAKAAPTVSAPPARSMSRRENVASRIVLLPRLSCIWCHDGDSRFASRIYDCFPRATIRCNVDGL
jgi:hypothetical protein